MLIFHDSKYLLPKIFLLCTVTASFALLQIALNRPIPTLVSISQLEWNTLQGCDVDAVPASLPQQQGALGTFGLDKHFKRYSCSSRPFRPSSELIGVEFAGTAPLVKGSRAAITLTTASGAVIEEKRLNELIPSGPFYPSWKEVQFYLPNLREEIIVSVVSNGRTTQDVGIRPRLNFYNTSPLFKLHTALKTYILPLLILTAATLALILSIRLPLRDRVGLLLSFLLLSVATHFRSQVFFYFDEWHVLARFLKLGLPGVIYTHNEHFLPCFFLTYLGEMRLFGANYLLFTSLALLLHSLNAVALYFLLKRLFPHAGPQVLFIASSLFVVSALHAEALQWAFEQCLLLSQLCVLGSLILAFDYFKAGGFIRLVVIFVLSLLAPLFFGNGFVVVLQVAGMGVYLASLKLNQENLKTRLKSLASLLVATAMGAALAALLYLLNREGAGHGIDAADPWSKLGQVFEYVFVGSYLGTALRGLGIFPSLEMNAPQLFYRHLPRLLRSSFSDPALTFAWAGFLTTLLLLVLPRLLRGKFSPRLWLLGQFVIITAFVLPSLGRWQLGIEQSLSLRYSYASLPGLFILLMPTFLTLASAASTKSIVNSLVAGLCFSLLALHLFSQLQLNANFTYFQEHGTNTRRYLLQEESWQKEQVKDEALAPYYPPSTTPGKGGGEVFSIYKQLDSRKSTSNGR